MTSQHVSKLRVPGHDGWEKAVLLEDPTDVAEVDCCKASTCRLPRPTASIMNLRTENMISSKKLRISV